MPSALSCHADGDDEARLDCQTACVTPRDGRGMAGKETHETGSGDAATVLFQVDDPLSMAARSVTKQFGRARKECCHAGTLRGPEKTSPIILGEMVLLFDTSGGSTGKEDGV